MRLEEKHILPYQPYGLKFLIIKLDRFRLNDYWNNVSESKVHSFNLGMLDVLMNGFEYYPNDPHLRSVCAKPILRPLSDLEKKVKTPDGFERVIYDELSLYSAQKFDKDIGLEEWWAKDVELLKAYHVDVFGLIESGLAIDINDLK
mgnify:CR=1 FL=1